MRTRTSSLVKQRLIQINYRLNYFKLSFIAGLQFIPFKNKLLTLIYFSNGSISYFLASEMHELFTFLYYNKYNKLKKLKIKANFLILFRIKKLTFVSHLELKPGHGAQYTRSPGTKSKIIKFDKEKHTALLQLASGAKKFFSYYSFVLLGPIALPLNFKCHNPKAGY
jgi:ribosomal protein L2